MALRPSVTWLRQSENLIFGGNPDYMEREDGYPMICEAYGMNFKGTVDVDIALKYQAMAIKRLM